MDRRFHGTDDGGFFANEMSVIAIDPGPEESAMLVWSGERVDWSAKLVNQHIIYKLESWRDLPRPFPLCIEKIASFGMPVGAEVFETVFWSGRFAECYGAERTDRITRIAVKSHICHSAKAKDANIRQALIDRFGSVGTKKNPGPLYGICGDLWSALAVGVTWFDQNGKKAAA